MGIMNLNDHQLKSLRRLQFYDCTKPDDLGFMIVYTHIIKAIALIVSSEVLLVLCWFDECRPHRGRRRLALQALPKYFIQNQIRHLVFRAPIKFL